MEEKEFKEKYHTTKIYRFEPPNWKEFLATRDENSFAHWSCGDIAVVMVEENNEKGIQQLEEKDKIIQMQQNIKRFDIEEMLTENIKLN